MIARYKRVTGKTQRLNIFDVIHSRIEKQHGKEFSDASRIFIKILYQTKKLAGIQKLFQILKFAGKVPELEIPKIIDYLFWKLLDIITNDSDADPILSLPYGYLILNGQVLKYNYRVDRTKGKAGTIFFGERFYVKKIDGKDKIYELKNDEIMLDRYILNTTTGKPTNPFDILNTQTGNLETPDDVKDGFHDVWATEYEGSGLGIRPNRDDNSKSILINHNEIFRVKDGMIVSVNLQKTKIITKRTFYYAKALKSLTTTATSFEDDVLRIAPELENLDADKASELGARVAHHVPKLKKANLLKTKNIGYGALGQTLDFSPEAQPYTSHFNLPSLTYLIAPEAKDPYKRLIQYVLKKQIGQKLQTEPTSNMAQSARNFQPYALKEKTNGFSR